MAFRQLPAPDPTFMQCRGQQHAIASLPRERPERLDVADSPAANEREFSVFAA